MYPILFYQALFWATCYASVKQGPLHLLAALVLAPLHDCRSPPYFTAGT